MAELALIIGESNQGRDGESLGIVCRSADSVNSQPHPWMTYVVSESRKALAR